MTIYPDASFLVSWLYQADPLNAKARLWFGRHQSGDFFISDSIRFRGRADASKLTAEADAGRLFSRLHGGKSLLFLLRKRWVGDNLILYARPVFDQVLASRRLFRVDRGRGINSGKGSSR
jgi:hypothetical protein